MPRKKAVPPPQQPNDLMTCFGCAVIGLIVFLGIGGIISSCGQNPPTTPPAAVVERIERPAPPPAVAPNPLSYYPPPAGSESTRQAEPVRQEDHPAGATAQCNDGTYSYSHSHRGTCSHHGGVAVWYR